MYDLASLAEPLVFSLVRRKSEIIYTSYVTSGELEISTSITNKEYCGVTDEWLISLANLLIHKYKDIDIDGKL